MFEKWKTRRQLQSACEALFEKNAELERRVRALEFMHGRCKESYTYYNGEHKLWGSVRFNLEEKMYFDEHPYTSMSVDTKSAEKVTFEELARFVLDGEPIKREKMVKHTSVIYPQAMPSEHGIVDLNDTGEYKCTKSD
jgi:hypothetical protein